MADTLRVVLAAPLAEELCQLIEAREPRVSLVRDHALMPPQRHGADHEGDPAWQRTPAQQAAFDAMVDTAEALYGIPSSSGTALQRTVAANPGLRWVQTMAAGGGGQVKGAKLDAAQLGRVVFTTSAGVHGGPLAEYALFGVLAGAKNLPRLRRDQADRAWPERWQMGQVSDQTVLVLGLGGIGQALAGLLKALGARVYGTSRRGGHVPGVDRIVPVEQLASVVPEVDAIVVTLPGTDATTRLLGADLLALVKPGVTVVNVGRGTVIDEDALVAALGDGRVGLAVLDVFAAEPLRQDSPLWTLPNVIASPHTAACSDAEGRRIAELFADNATRLLDGREMRNVVDTVHFY